MTTMAKLRFTLDDSIYHGHATPADGCISGVSIRVYSTEGGAALSVGGRKAPFTDPAQLRQLAAAISQAADLIEHDSVASPLYLSAD